jgi:hypothetical protein
MIIFTEAANEVSTKVTKARRLVPKQPASVDTWKSAWKNSIKKKVNELFLHFYDQSGKQKIKGKLHDDTDFNVLVVEVEKLGLVAEVQGQKGAGTSFKIQKAADVSTISLCSTLTFLVCAFRLENDSQENL